MYFIKYKVIDVVHSHKIIKVTCLFGMGAKNTEVPREFLIGARLWISHLYQGEFIYHGFRLLRPWVTSGRYGVFVPLNNLIAFSIICLFHYLSHSGFKLETDVSSIF